MSNIINAITGDAYGKFGRLLQEGDIHGVQFKVYCSPTIHQLIQDTLNDEAVVGTMIQSETLEVPPKPWKFTSLKVPFVGEFEIVEVGSLTGYFLMKKADKNEQ